MGSQNTSLLCSLGYQYIAANSIRSHKISVRQCWHIGTWQWCGCRSYCNTPNT